MFGPVNDTWKSMDMQKVGLQSTNSIYVTGTIADYSSTIGEAAMNGCQKISGITAADKKWIDMQSWYVKAWNPDAL